MMTTQIADVLVNNVITYRIKNVYGRDNIYIISEHHAAIKQLTGKETIDNNDMKVLESLGFVFERGF